MQPTMMEDAIPLLIMMAFPIYFLIGGFFRFCFSYSCGACGFDCVCLLRVVDFFFTWYYDLVDLIRKKI